MIADLFVNLDDIPPPSPRPRCSLIPRDYQERAIVNSFRLWSEGHRGVMCRIPTGGGKTFTGTCIADLWNQQGDNYRTVVMCHERQLIGQFTQDIEDVLGVRPAVEMADLHCKGNEPIIVASRQTLYVKKDGINEISRLFKFRPDLNWLLIIDEAHRYTRHLKICRPIIEWFEQNPNHRRLLLTATPERSDKVTFEGLATGIASDYMLFDVDGGPSAVNDGWAVPYDQRYIVVEGVDFKTLKLDKGDFDPAELERILSEQGELAAVCDPLLDIVGKRRTLIFSPTKAMAKAVALYINAKLEMQASKSIDGDSPDSIRKNIFREHQSGAFQFLSVCGLCREGYNDPDIGAVAIFRITKSRSLKEQMCGRGCRPKRGTVSSEMTPEERRRAIAESDKPTCVAEGTPILTDIGLVPIEDVTTAMKVWDGVEFVTHCGIISRGHQPVITYLGLTATSDHEVWIHDETNRQTAAPVRATFGDCAAKQIAIRVTGNGREAVREADCCFRHCGQIAWAGEIDDGMPMRTPFIKGLFRVDRWRGWLSQVRFKNWYSSMALASLQWCQGSVCQLEKLRLRSVWWAWNPVQLCFNARNGAVGDGYARASSRLRVGSNQQRRTLRSGEHSVCDSIAKHVESARSAVARGNARISIGSSGNRLLGQQPEAKARGRVVVERDHRVGDNANQTATGSIQGTARVFDILNAGPRHRFTAAGLLVSNCMIIDLTGATGLGDVPSTVDILAASKPDDVRALANRKMQSKPPGEAGDVQKAIQDAEEEIKEEKRLKREAKLKREQDEADRRAKLKAKVTYTEHKVKSGQAGKSHKRPKNHNPPSPGMCNYLRALGVNHPDQMSMQQARAVIGKLTSGHGRDYVVRGGPNKGKTLKELPIPVLKDLIAERNTGSTYDNEFQSEVELYRHHYREDHPKPQEPAQ